MIKSLCDLSVLWPWALEASSIHFHNRAKFATVTDRLNP